MTAKIVVRVTVRVHHAALIAWKCQPYMVVERPSFDPPAYLLRYCQPIGTRRHERRDQGPRKRWMRVTPSTREADVTSIESGVLHKGSDVALSFMTREEMSAALNALEQALFVHQKWSEDLFAVLVCRLAPDDADLLDDAYRTCPFGTWYYSSREQSLNEHPGFLAISVEHEQMHRIAARILRGFVTNDAVEVGDFTSLVGAMRRLRLEIVNLSRELSDGITNLDPLTGATGRNGMLAVLRRHRELSERELESCVVVMMDLDLFKNVNDRFGHQAGDRVLVEIVRYIKMQLRPFDELFRYGGEEFLLCIPFVDLSSALLMVERLRDGVAALSIDIDDEREVQITISFGVALLDPVVPVEQSIARADRALYAAKSSGRNKSLLWEESMT